MRRTIAGTYESSQAVVNLPLQERAAGQRHGNRSQTLSPTGTCYGETSNETRLSSLGRHERILYYGRAVLL